MQRPTGKIMPHWFRGNQGRPQEQKEQGENRRCGEGNREQDHTGCVSEGLLLASGEGWEQLEAWTRAAMLRCEKESESRYILMVQLRGFVDKSC